MTRNKKARLNVLQEQPGLSEQGRELESAPLFKVSEPKRRVNGFVIREIKLEINHIAALKGLFEI